MQKTFLGIPVLLIVISVKCSFGLPDAAQHAEKWYECFCFNKNNALTTYFEDFSTAIDSVRGLKDALLDQIKAKNPTLYEKLPKSFGLLDHRYFFHWGYNTGKISDHTNAQAFRDKLRSKLSDTQRISETLTDADTEALYRITLQFIDEEWIKRKRKLQEMTSRTFGLATKSSAMATIIYEIHIIADYGDIDLEPLGKLRVHVDQELVEGGLRELFPVNEQELDIFCKEILRIRRDFTINDKEKSVRILDLLKTKLPSILKKQWGNTLKKKGIMFSEEVS